jgi:hypothetical protein
MKIAKRQLRKLIREAIIQEAEFYDETPAGQLTGTEAEDAKFNQQLDAEKQMKSAGLTKDEIAQMWNLIKSGDLEGQFIETPMYEKLFGWFAFDGPDLMPYGTAKARDGDPDDWILDRLEFGSLPPNWADSLPPQRQAV